MTYIEGGVCAAQGFTANGVHCGIRKNRTKRDLALIFSDRRAAAAAVYTQNRVFGAPIAVTRENLIDGWAQAMICNSGNANTCNPDGIEIAQQMCALTARSAGIAASDIIIASTGVIGQPLPLAPIAAGLPSLAAGLGPYNEEAAEAIMTTDTFKKEVAVEFSLGGTACRLGGMAKGSGMIHPNMATMLIFLTTDAAISPTLLQKALSDDTPDTFNMISVDGDTSTNDMCCIMANGAAGNAPVETESADYEAFCAALRAVTEKLCVMLARDGEGATRLLTCKVSGARDVATAKVAAKGVISSSLVKAAFFGADANWGRILCALGYSGAEFDPAAVDVTFASKKGFVDVCAAGVGLPFSEEYAKKVILEEEIEIIVSLHDGGASATAWGCDLTYDYVKINGDYRT